MTRSFLSLPAFNNSMLWNRSLRLRRNDYWAIISCSMVVLIIYHGSLIRTVVWWNTFKISIGYLAKIWVSKLNNGAWRWKGLRLINRAQHKASIILLITARFFPHCHFLEAAGNPEKGRVIIFAHHSNGNACVDGSEREKKDVNGSRTKRYVHDASPFSKIALLRMYTFREFVTLIGIIFRGGQFPFFLFQG